MQVIILKRQTAGKAPKKKFICAKSVSPLFDVYFDIPFKLPVINYISFLAFLFFTRKIYTVYAHLFVTEDDIGYILASQSYDCLQGNI